MSVLNFLSDFSQRVNLCLQKPFERFVQGTAGKYCLLSEILLSNEVGFHFFFLSKCVGLSVFILLNSVVW